MSFRPSAPTSLLVQVDIRQLTDRLVLLGLAPSEIKAAMRKGALTTINPVRNAMRKLWRGQHFARSGQRLTRRAIVRGVRVIVTVHRDLVMAATGISVKGTNKKARIARILDSGFRHPTAGRVPGRHIRRQLLPILRRQGALYADLVIAAAHKIIGKRGTTRP